MSSDTDITKNYFQPVQMGLGDTLTRLFHIEFLYRNGITNIGPQLLEERKMILTALNSIPINVGFDCNNDGVPDTVEIFEKSVSTSCCRLVGTHDLSRRAPILNPPIIPQSTQETIPTPTPTPASTVRRVTTESSRRKR